MQLCFVALVFGISTANGLVSSVIMKKISKINQKGPYLGIVVPNNFELDPLLSSPRFVEDTKYPTVDFSGLINH